MELLETEFVFKELSSTRKHEHEETELNGFRYHSSQVSHHGMDTGHGERE